MKKSVFACFLFLCLSSLASAQFFGVHNNPYYISGGDVEFVGKDKIVTSSGSTVGDYISETRGRFFSRYAVNNFSIVESDMVGDSMLIQVASEGKIRIYKECHTTNWSINKTISSSQINSVDFINDSTGIVCGAFGRIRLTRDGAETFKLIETGVFEDELIKSKWVNDSTAFHVAEKGNFYKTEWDSIVESSFIPDVFTLTYMDFYDYANGLAVNNIGDVFITSDSAKTWTKQEKVNDDWIYGIYYLSKDTVFILGGNAYLGKSVDGGNSWKTIRHIDSTGYHAGSYNRMNFAPHNPNYGIITGSGSMLETYDRGLTWGHKNEFFNEILSTGDSIVIAGGNMGIQRSLDFGQTWTTLPMDTLPRIGSGESNPDGTVLFSGGNGVFVSKDLGATFVFKSKINNESRGVIDAAYLGNGVIILSGEDGLVQRSEDNGDSFVELPSLGGEDLVDIQFPDPKIGFILNSRGTLYRSINGGLSWEMWSQDPASFSQYFGDIYFFSPQFGFITAQNTVLRTVDGGKMWTEVNKIEFNDIRSINDTTYIAHSRGSGLRVVSKDKGITWKEMYYGLHTNDEPECLVFNGRNQLVAGSSRGTITGLGAFSHATGTYKVCQGAFVDIPVYQPFYDIGSPTEGVFEIVELDKSFESAIVLGSAVVDSFAKPRFTVPNGIASGIYKTRWRRKDNREMVSFDGYFLIQPQLDVELVVNDSTIHAIPNMPVTNYGWQRDVGFGFGYISETSDSLAAEEGVPYRVVVDGNCCEFTSDVVVVKKCNGQFQTMPYPATTEICAGDSVEINNVFYSTPDVVWDTLQNGLGCDSIVAYQLVINTLKESYQIELICPGDSTLFNGTYYSKEGDHSVIIPVAGGCDSISTLSIAHKEVPSRFDYFEFCQGDSALFAGNYYQENGFVMDTLSSLASCDTIALAWFERIAVDTSFSVVVDTLLATSSGPSTWQWYDCDKMEAIAGEVGDSLVIEKSGNYALIVSNGNCTDTSSCKFVQAVGIQSYEKGSNIQIYPNPSTGEFSISNLEGQSFSITCYSLDGKLVESFEYNGRGIQTYQLNVPNGIYLLHLYRDGVISQMERLTIME